MKLTLISNTVIQVSDNSDKVIGRFDKWDLDRLFNAHPGASLTLV